MTLRCDIVTIESSVHKREAELQVYTNAPSDLDYAGTTVVGDLGTGYLRIVSVNSREISAKEQLRRYEEFGYFATLNRETALEYVIFEGRLEHPTVSDFHVEE